MNDLIEFPHPTADWTDSGEGGQFVMLVVPEPDGWTNSCCVDVQIMLSQPDVCHTPNDFWPPHDSKGFLAQQGLHQYLRYREQDAQMVVQDATATPSWAGRLPRGINYREWNSWVLRAKSWDDVSKGVLAAVHMGSSHYSMWSETGGHYWTASQDDLTREGRAIRDSLQGAFEIEPVLLTFLDT